MPAFRSEPTTKRPFSEGLFLLLILGGLLSSCALPSGQPEPTPTLLPYQTPDWFDNAVLYSIFVRSYADSDADGIGDLNGITNRLDYIQELGVDVIWLLPIYPSPSYHGYDVTDFFAVNPEYGTLEDLQELVSAVHSRDMRVILDFVPSHLSNQNPLFLEAYRNPGAENEEWFVFTSENNTQYAGFANSKEMPRFNHYNPEVVDYLIDAALFWADLDGDGDFTEGVDGFRVDNATFPPQEFLFSMRQELKTANPDILLLGETWVTDVGTMSRYFENQFDALFDFGLYSIAQGNQNSNGDGMLAGNTAPMLLASHFKEQAEKNPGEAQAVRFFSTHDTNRIASEIGGDPDRQKLAASLLTALPGPIMIYYGEEIGMPGQKGTAPWWDAYRREPMDWYTDEIGPDHATWFMEDDRWNTPLDGISVEEQEPNPDSLLNHWRALIALRKSNQALSGGELVFPGYSASAQGGLVFIRQTASSNVIAFFNFSDGEITLTLDAALVSAESPHDLLTGDLLPPITAGEPFTLTLPPANAIYVSP